MLQLHNLLREIKIVVVIYDQHVLPLMARTVHMIRVVVVSPMMEILLLVNYIYVEVIENFLQDEKPVTIL